MMTEKQYNVRAGYYYEYTGICRNKEENLTTNEVCDKLNSLIDKNEQLQKKIQELEIGENEIILKQETTINQLIKENKQLKLQWITNQQEVECLTEENTKLKLENEYLKILDDGDIQ